MAESVFTAKKTEIRGQDLRGQLRRSERKKKLTAIALVSPLLLYIIINFVFPVGFLLLKSIDNREASELLKRTHSALREWNGENLPSEAAYAALVSDLRDAFHAKNFTVIAKRLNSALPGFQALISRTVRELPQDDTVSAKEALEKIDLRWGQINYWRTIKQASGFFTTIYFLQAFDLTVNPEGEIVLVPETMRVFNKLWLRTFWMALVITVVCLVLGYPLAYLLANAPKRVSNILMILLLLPFWTSFLVRTTAWVVLLQTEGVVNDLGIFLNLWSERIQLIHNRTGVYVAMAHILVPYMVLPLYSVMSRISPSHMRAAKSLGANPFVAFWKVYVPQTIQGVGVGCLFVYILALGFWVTPALLGGRGDQMISYFIAYFTNETLHWGLATALGVLLLFFTGIIFYLFKLIFGLDKLQMGAGVR
jgi:putative spermidine/putrescine transport system permease protein